MFFDAASTFLNNEPIVAEESAARPRLLPAMEMKSRRVGLRVTEFGLVMRWTVLRKNGASWDERHGRQSREGSGDRGGGRRNRSRVACAPHLCLWIRRDVTSRQAGFGLM